MKKTATRLTALLLAALTLTATACQNQPTPAETSAPAASEPAAPGTQSPTETQEETDVSYVRPTFTDLSHDVPAYVRHGDCTAVAHSEGGSTESGRSLDFDGTSGLFILSTPDVELLHDSSTCKSCGFTEYEGEKCFRLCTNSMTNAGLRLTLNAPISAAAVQSITVTYRTEGPNPSGIIRVLEKGTRNLAVFINECPSLDGAVNEWRTVDLNVSEFDRLDDENGNISSFDFYYRNKSNTDLYIKNITIHTSMDDLCVIDEVRGSHVYEMSVAKYLADTVAARFTAMGVEAEVKAEITAFTPNSSDSKGRCSYTVTATLKDGTVMTHSAKRVILSPVTEVWLDDSAEDYGSSHDSFDQWQTTFDQGGLVQLTNNTVTCPEGVSTMEYAVIPADGDYRDAALTWYAPQLLTMSESGFESLFVNAFMDYGATLAEGGMYRFLLRAVTNNRNYILHLDIPFIYEPLSPEAVSALESARASLTASDLSCDPAEGDKASFAAEALAALVNNDKVGILSDVTALGASSFRVNATLSYAADVVSPRLPAYTLNGAPFAAVYSLAGSAYSLTGLTVDYGMDTGTIHLTTPFDGDRNVVVASEEVWRVFNSPLEDVVAYDFLRFGKDEELCHPKPVTLTWTDDALAAGKVYTVTLSMNPDLSDAVTYTTDATALEVYYLYLGKSYYWQVTAGSETSPVYTFRVADGYARYVQVDNISNFRDMGGYLTVDGKRVKQGMAYRSGQLFDATSEGKSVALNELGIKTDLDLRGAGASDWRPDVNFISTGMGWYQHIFSDSYTEAARKTISAFAYEENYPILFHCSLGRDRTGTTSFLLLGLLGVDEDTLAKEYLVSFTARMGRSDSTTARQHYEGNYLAMVTGMKKYAERGASLSEQIEGYLLSIGVTAEEIASIRRILLEDAE